MPQDSNSDLSRFQNYYFGNSELTDRAPPEHLMPQVRLFQPKARIYFDSKRNNDQKLDLFQNGSIMASIDILELYFPRDWRLVPSWPLLPQKIDGEWTFPLWPGHEGEWLKPSDLGWRWGLTFGAGITSSVSDIESASLSSPILTMSAGARFDFPLANRILARDSRTKDSIPWVGLEFGVQRGQSTNEALGEPYDWGGYVGITLTNPVFTLGGGQ
ncbi:MAG: hypothetical protein KDA42_17495 [Planctomycetales bacterium]|nr:hypothetical protein [Planctomycetales bacterium]